MKQSNFQKNVKQVLGGQTEVIPDLVTCKQNGTVEVRRSYFYRHGSSAETWAEKVQKVLQTASLDVVTWGRDEWADGPKTSYFCAVVCEKAT